MLCHSDTYHSCAKCHEAVCNRPDCYTSVNESHTGYSEDHPKAGSICKSCSGSKKRQSSISTLFHPRFVFPFITQRKNARNAYVRIWPVYVCISPNTGIYGLHNACIWKFLRRANREKLSQMP